MAKLLIHEQNIKKKGWGSDDTLLQVSHLHEKIVEKRGVGVQMILSLRCCTIYDHCIFINIYYCIPLPQIDRFPYAQIDYSYFRLARLMSNRKRKRGGAPIITWIVPELKSCDLNTLDRLHDSSILDLFFGSNIPKEMCTVAQFWLAYMIQARDLGIPYIIEQTPSAVYSSMKTIFKRTLLMGKKNNDGGLSLLELENMTRHPRSYSRLNAQSNSFVRDFKRLLDKYGDYKSFWDVTGVFNFLYNQDEETKTQNIAQRVAKRFQQNTNEIDKTNFKYQYPFIEHIKAFVKRGDFSKSSIDFLWWGYELLKYRVFSNTHFVAWVSKFIPTQLSSKRSLLDPKMCDNTSTLSNLNQNQDMIIRIENAVFEGLSCSRGGLDFHHLVQLEETLKAQLISTGIEQFDKMLMRAKQSMSSHVQTLDSNDPRLEILAMALLCGSIEDMIIRGYVSLCRGNNMLDTLNDERKLVLVFDQIILDQPIPNQMDLPIYKRDLNQDVSVVCYFGSPRVEIDSTKTVLLDKTHLSISGNWLKEIIVSGPIYIDMQRFSEDMKKPLKQFSQTYDFQKHLIEIRGGADCTLLNGRALFKGCKRLIRFDSQINTSMCTDMSYMFCQAKLFNKPLGEYFDTRNVTDMSYMFYGASTYNQPFGPKFDTKRVQNMSSMFFGANKFDQELGSLFYLCTKKSVDRYRMFPLEYQKTHPVTSEIAESSNKFKFSN